VARLPVVEAWKVAGRKLLWWPDSSLLWWWGRGTVELVLLLLELSRLELWAMAPKFAVVVVDAADPDVGYTPCGTLEEHHKNYHYQRI
jgi:hypothetical protein